MQRMPTFFAQERPGTPRRAAKSPVVNDDRIAVIEYGGGNMGSLRSALARRQAQFFITDDPAQIAHARAAILPGDGAFGATMDALVERGLDTAITRHIETGKPFLGICVGMQVLFAESDEYGGHAGLGVFPGVVRRFIDAPRVPHMGWNDLRVEREHPFVVGIASGDYAYFLHSYRVVESDVTLASCDYGERFAAIVARDNVMATQFHPEKSQQTGAMLLDNFIRIAA